MVEAAWGLTSAEWAAISSIAGAVAAIAALLTAIIALKTSRASLRLSQRIHAENGPLPVLTVWNQSETRNGSTQSRKMIVRVENQGRTRCSIKPPVIDRLPDGGQVLVDSRFSFQGPKANVLILEPWDHQDWTLNLQDLDATISQTHPVRIHVTTAASGRQSLRRKVILNGSRRMRDRWRLLLP